MEAFVISVIIVAVILVLFLFFNFIPVGLISASAPGSVASLPDRNELRRVIHQNHLTLIKATKAGLRVNVNQLEEISSRRNVDRVVNALIAHLGGTESPVL